MLTPGPSEPVASDRSQSGYLAALCHSRTLYHKWQMKWRGATFPGKLATRGQDMRKSLAENYSWTIDNLRNHHPPCRENIRLWSCIIDGQDAECDIGGQWPGVTCYGSHTPPLFPTLRCHHRSPDTEAADTWCQLTPGADHVYWHVMMALTSLRRLHTGDQGLMSVDVTRCHSWSRLRLWCCVTGFCRTSGVDPVWPHTHTRVTLSTAAPATPDPSHHGDTIIIISTDIG